MTPRPKNPPPDRRQEILDAALRVFAAKGYEAATNADIARMAGVTPAALYYYFPSKADLFRATFTERKSTIVGNVEQMGDQLQAMPPEVLFPAVAHAIGGFLSEERTQAIVRIILSEGTRNPAVLEFYRQDVVGQVAPLAMRYLQSQMEQGRIRTMDPRLFAVLLFGPLLVATIGRDVLKLEPMQDLTNEMIADELIKTILPALLAQEKE